jgi:hypothetical protein
MDESSEYRAFTRRWTMPDRRDPFDDDLGPDPMDRGSGKIMDGGGGGGGDLIDPSYEDALRIMGRAHELPSPFEQRALTMDNPEGAELARRLTALRQAAGVEVSPFGAPPTLGAPGETASAREAVSDFIIALQEIPPDSGKLGALRDQIEGAEGDVQAAVERVCEHPAVQAKLEGDTP